METEAEAEAVARGGRGGVADVAVARVEIVMAEAGADAAVATVEAATADTGADAAVRRVEAVMAEGEAAGVEAVGQM